MARHLTEELQKVAAIELNEVPNQIEDDLQNLREWIKKQSHLIIRADDQWLIGFLRGCKFSLQKTKEKLDFFYTMRTLLLEFFANRDPFLQEIQSVLKAGVFLSLPKTVGPAGPRILLVRYAQVDPEATPLSNLIKVYLMMYDILMQEDDNFVVSGLYIIVDFKNFPLKLLPQYTPSLLKKFYMCFQIAYPSRLKKLYFINVPAACESIINLFKNFFDSKLKSRIVTLSPKHFTKIYDSIPKELLPTGYGNERENLDELTELWKSKIESYRDWYLEDTKYRSYEELRPGRPKTSSDIFGVEGSFRKLNID